MTDLHPAPPPAAPPPHASLPPRTAITPGTIVTTVAILVVLAAAWFWSDLLLMAFGAILIAIALRAGARGLNRLLGLNVKLGVLVVLLGVVGAVALLVRLAGPAVAEQFRELISALPQSWDAVQDWLQSLPMADTVIEQIQDGEEATTMGENAAQLAERLPGVFSMVLGGLNSVLGSLSSVFVLLILSLYVAMEADLYRAGAIRLVPLRRRARAAQIMDELGSNLGRWMAGQAVDMLVVALLAGIGLWLLDVPLAFILAVIAVGIGRVGGAHHFAVLGDGVLAFQDLHDDRLGGHELDQLAIEGTVLVDLVELAGLGGRQVDALGRDDAQAGILELGGDLAGQVAAGRVGLDDGKGAFDRHDGHLVCWRENPR